MNLSLDREQLMDLISALETAPLRVLALGGISYAKLDLFDRLAEAFPDPEALTLVLRESRQTSTTPCTWPHATWEYAPSRALPPSEALRVELLCASRGRASPLGRVAHGGGVHGRALRSSDA